jgi:hypothetical protein
MKFPKLPRSTVFGLIAFTAGAIGFSAVSINNDRIEKQEARYRDIMYRTMMADPTQQSPIEQVDSWEIAQEVPADQLPLDARPESGITPEPGSLQKRIVFKDSPMPPPVSPAVRPGYALVLEKTKEFVPQTKDPIWKLALVDQTGKELGTLKALSGRANRQTSNRNQGGNKSPLPTGVYTIDHYGIERGPFGDPELGKGFWVPITPMFSTGRSDLGFHQDPSWGKLNGESGTSGCVGLESAEATSQLVQWIKRYHIRKVIVLS